MMKHTDCGIYENFHFVLVRGGRWGCNTELKPFWNILTKLLLMLQFRVIASNWFQVTVRAINIEVAISFFEFSLWLSQPLNRGKNVTVQALPDLA